MRLSSKDQTILLSLAAAITPQGRLLSAPDRDFLERLQDFLDNSGEELRLAFRGALRALNLASVPLCGRALTQLSLERRIGNGERLNEGPAHTLLRACSLPLKLSRVGGHLASELGIEAERPAASGERARWRERAMDGRELEEEEIEVDCVVVGSGAGGLPWLMS